MHKLYFGYSVIEEYCKSMGADYGYGLDVGLHLLIS